jgi:hypothetical protein
VLVERPVIRVQDSDSAMLRAIEFSNVFSQYEALPASIQSAILKLHQQQNVDWSQGHHSSDSYFSIHECILNNAFCSGDDHRMFIHGSRFNHSCIPNCCQYFVQDHDLMVFSVCNSITAGSEMTISYVNDENKFGLGFDEFHALMMRAWNFRCSCPSCCDRTTLKKLEMLATLLDNMKNAMTEESVKRVKKQFVRSSVADFQQRISQAIRFGENFIIASHALGFGFSETQREVYLILIQSAQMQHSAESKNVAKQYGAKYLELLELQMGDSRLQPAELTQGKIMSNLKAPPPA